MTRAEIENQIVQSTNRFLLLQLPTSYGKTKIALNILKKRIKLKENERILVVIPRLVLIENWKKEISKWRCKKYLPNITFTTYVSLHKHIGHWDFVIFDECHHLSDRCLEIIKSCQYDNAVLLSATVNIQKRYNIRNAFRGIAEINVSVKEAVKEGILPDPKVFLIPLSLNDVDINCEIVKNPKKQETIVVPFRDRWMINRTKNQRIIIKCTEKQFYDNITSYIEWCRKRIDSPIFKQLFLRKSGERLKWLSDRKTTFINSLLQTLHPYRTLTFCNGIAQTEMLGKYCINSQNNKSEDILNKFNKGKINHITACNMLDEGVNLKSCQIGIYASLNSSDRMIVQKLGRLLRHHNPIIIIPYYEGTRDEELVNKMCLNYNNELIQKVSINDLVKQL